MTGQGAWFVYRQRNGRFTAWPCSLAGWAVLLFVVTAMIGACLVLVPHFAPMGAGIAITGQLLLMTIGFGLLVWLVRARGRRID